MTASHVELHTIEFCETATTADMPGDAAWSDTTLPFDVHHALWAAGRISHPYRDGNADSLDWIQQSTWWVRAEFTLDELVRGATLRLDGLDTVGTVWLNGSGVGSAANTFRPAVFDVGAALRPGRNEVLVRIDPPLEGLTAPEDSSATAKRVGQLMGRTERTEGHGLFGDLRTLRRRKPIVDWGWDFAPSLPSLGLTGITVTWGDQPLIASVVLQTVAIDTTVDTADVVVMAASNAPTGSAVAVTLTSPNGEVINADSAVDGHGRVEAPIRVARPQLWWPLDLGGQPLYELRVQVGDSSVVRRIGIRTVTVDRSPDGDGGRHFRFVVNGVPVFARGASVVPADHLRPDADRDRSLVALAADAGMNMLRVWGGGGYGSDSFYDAADEVGVLVWQDFPFACADYPDGELLAEVKAEAGFQTARLGSHPSLALWCGNNEVHAMHQLAHGNLDPGPWGHFFFHELLPEIVCRESPGTPYWPGSPYGEHDPAGVNGVSDGDRHAWEVWHGLPLGAPSPEKYASFGESAHFRRYRYDTGRFISEFGIIAAPAVDTLGEWICSDELRLDSEVFRSHIRDTPKEKALALLEIETGLPRDLPEYVRFTQTVQAEGLKFGIEHYRRAQPHTTGTLIWQLNDPWPGISWSLIDFAGRQKDAYHVVRRAFAPVIASFELTDGGTLELWVANSTPQPALLNLGIRIDTMSEGRTLHSDMVDTEAAAQSATCVWRMDLSETDVAPDVVARVRERSGKVPANRLYFAAIRDIPFPDPQFEFDVELLGDGRAEVTIFAGTELFGVTVYSPHASARFDDNVVDLAFGESTTVSVSGLPADAETQSFHVFTRHPRITSLTSSQVIQKTSRPRRSVHVSDTVQHIF